VALECRDGGVDVKCSLCGAPAVFERKFSGIKLCRRCFMRSIEDKVRWTIGKYKLLERDDYTLLAVSGGKDSVVMMHIMAKIESDFPEASLIAVTIDEGIPGYREVGFKIASKNAKLLNIPHRVFSFKDFYGYSLKEIVEIAERKGIPYHACTYCGVLRRKILNVKAKELGVTKIATAHNLDDEVQTIFMNIVRGDVNRMIRVLSLESIKHPGFVPRIKPMRLIPEAEIALYAYFKGIDFYTVDCPYSQTSLRNEFRVFINEFEKKHPGMKFSVISFFEKISNLLLNSMPPLQLKECKYCGEPSVKDVCRACELLEELGLLDF